MKKELNLEDKYVVISASIITSFDRKIITRLYQPLIGACASSLYFSLQSELEFDNTISKEKHTIKSLVSMMNIKLEDLVLCISKLEAIGLIKTKRSVKDNFYAFTLFAPMSPHDYFDNPIYDSLLQNSLSDEDYSRNKMYFTQSKLNDNDFEDISSEFSDVFNFNSKGNFVGGENNISKKTSEIKMNFNFNAFYNRLEQLNISKNVVEGLEKDIALVALSNKLSAVDIADYIGKSIVDNKVNIVKLRKLVAPVKEETVDNKVADTGNEKLNKLINLYNSVTPLEFLLIKNNYSPVVSSEKAIIETLINEFKLKSGVINCLIDYSLQMCDNKLSRAYVEKVASSLARAKITDSLDAMNYLMGNKKSVKPVINTVEKQNNEEVTDEQIQEALKKLDALKKERDKNGN